MRRGNNDQAERGTNVGQKQVCRGRSGKQIKKINIRKKPKVETADQVMSHLPRCFFFFFSLIKQLQKMHQKQFVNELKTEACSLALFKSSGSPHSSLKAFDGWPWWLNRVHGCKDYGFGLVKITNSFDAKQWGTVSFIHLNNTHTLAISLLYR